jgi:hypothetical protein
MEEITKFNRLVYQSLIESAVQCDAEIVEGRRIRQEAGGRRQEAGGRRQEAGGRRQEAGGRRQEAGGRRQEAGGRRQEDKYRQTFASSASVSPAF